MKYDLCYVYSINPEQDKYQFLKKQSIKVLKSRKSISSGETWFSTKSNRFW